MAKKEQVPTDGPNEKRTPTEMLALYPDRPFIRRLRPFAVKLVIAVAMAIVVGVILVGLAQGQHRGPVDGEREPSPAPRPPRENPFTQLPGDYRFTRPPAPEPAPATPQPTPVPEPTLVAVEGVPAPPPPDPQLIARLESLRVELEAAIDSPVKFAITSPTGPREHAASSATSATTEQATIRKPTSNTWLGAGTTIPGVLQTGINTDLPGIVIGQVATDVYDGHTGRTLLIPQGARVIGRYGSEIHHGQNRVLITWQQLALPNGAVVELAGMSGTDLTGAAGLHDRVDYHPLRLTGAVLLSSLVALGGNAARVDRRRNEAASLVAETTAQQGSQVGQRIVDRELDVPPTITIRPGTPFLAIVERQLPLPPYRDDRNRAARR